MADNDYPECERFTGHMRRICRGDVPTVAIDGPSSTNEYRMGWGLAPITTHPRLAPQAKVLYYPPTEQPDTTAMRGMGDLIAKTIEMATFGLVQPCGGCNSRKEVLNTWWPFKEAVAATTALKKEGDGVDWAYGVTTVRPRLESGVLRRTLASLSRAGFDRPRLFIDGEACSADGFDKLGLEITRREQLIRPYGNWLLALLELYVRQPFADRYVMFQDDFVTCLGLREYLERTPYPEMGYLNLYTFPHNQPDELARRTVNGKRTHPELDPATVGFYPACQNGKGAVALVFDNHATKFLLSRVHMIERVQNSERGHRAIDGAVVEAMRQEGWTEYVHNPSLVQHTGDVSSMGNAKHAKANSFRGESFDVRELLAGRV